MNSINRDRVRAESFGARAEAYDQTRPSYPTELTSWITRDGVGTAVDVGCGTGQVALLLTAAGVSVIGVEPDRRMAEVARTHGVEVVVAPFEQWVPPRHDYDLVCSGTAWHWIDPTVGYDAAGGMLRSGGRLALFRNSYTYDPDVADGIRAAAQRCAPQLLHGCVPLGTAATELVGTHELEIAARTDLFVDVECRLFTHERIVNASEWGEELKTHSPIAMLDDAARARLLAALAHVISTSGRTTLRIRHETPCVTATRR